MRTVLKISTSNEEFYRLYRQALEDMAALRLPIGTPAQTVWFSCLQPACRGSLPIREGQPDRLAPERADLSGFARGALEILGSLQATERDDYRDAEPGKFLTSCAAVNSRISS